MRIRPLDTLHIKYKSKQKQTKATEVKHTMPASFISSIHALPDEVIGHVLTYTPRHDTAQILWDASQTDGLRLKYLRRYRVPNDAHKDEIFAHLAPSVCGATVYGDEDAPMCIIRTNISVGECVRFRVLIEKQQQMKRNAP